LQTFFAGVELAGAAGGGAGFVVTTKMVKRFCLLHVSAAIVRLAFEVLVL
jgi:hypothetical protein